MDLALDDVFMNVTNGREFVFLETLDVMPKKVYAIGILDHSLKVLHVLRLKIGSDQVRAFSDLIETKRIVRLRTTDETNT